MKNSLKKIMDGLSMQYADKYLPASQKDRILSNRPVKSKSLTNPDKFNIINPGESRSEKKHIAMLCNDVTNEGVLSYILSNSNDCSVDVLYHGAHVKTPSESFYKHARSSFVENNIDVRLVKLISDSVADIKNYLINHRTLQYLVTDSHDLLITEFLKNQKIQRQINVPIVLIN